MEFFRNALLENAIHTLVKELYEWKRLMVSLASAVQAAWPPNKYSGWALVLRKCSKSKHCTMCPHGMLWRHYYAKPTFLWARGKESYSETLPTDQLYCSKKKREAFIEAEVLRVQIMEHHRSLVALKIKLDRKKQGLALSHKKEIDDEFVKTIYEILDTILANYSISRKEIEKKLAEFKAFNPSYKGSVLFSSEERARKRKIHYSSKEEKKRMGA